MSWSVFFGMWVVTVCAAFSWDSGTGFGMMGIAAAAAVMRLVGYERGWRRFTVMPFVFYAFMTVVFIVRRLSGHP